MSLPQTIKELRTRQKMTQELLAERLGVSRQAVTKWENGQSRPSTQKLLMLAEVFQVPMSELIGEVPPSKSERRWPLRILVGLSAALLVFSGWSIFRRIGQSPSEIIGYADASTEIYVVSETGSLWPLYVITAAVVGVTVFIGIRRWRKGGKQG